MCAFTSHLQGFGISPLYPDNNKKKCSCLPWSVFGYMPGVRLLTSRRRPSHHRRSAIRVCEFGRVVQRSGSARHSPSSWKISAELLARIAEIIPPVRDALAGRDSWDAIAMISHCSGRRGCSPVGCGCRSRCLGCVGGDADLHVSVLDRM
ncbi:hypothetical protein OBBRIDRAFT_374129 [Obba rivulosa]|uniref:Uncharacterized protein n=1 Tax=Obba rivulosa TaxID=1052685 RepID=A0A8E2AMT1_9APHY|nr:hypothetical protein OBBRIDRAFT_374129 [Obba rivulosa]